MAVRQGLLAAQQTEEQISQLPYKYWKERWVL